MCKIRLFAVTQYEMWLLVSDWLATLILQISKSLVCWFGVAVIKIML